MHFWFVGEGPFAALCLEGLNRLLRPADNCCLTRIITGMPTRSGRGMKETPSPVEACAARLGLPAERTGRLSQNEALLASLQASPPDVVFVIDFGQIIREPFLSTPRWGCLNIHPSLLPRWRGAAPIQRALMNGDIQTGVTVFRLVPEMDAGPVLCQAPVPVGPDATASELYRTLSDLGAKIAAGGLKSLSEGTGAFTEQDHANATYAAKLARGEFETAWDWPAPKIHNTVRALDTSGGAFLPLKDGGRLKLWRTAFLDTPEETPGTVLRLDADGPVVACGAGALRLLEVQAPGKRRMKALDWARGLRLAPGARLK
ncbi:MAG: methionyl-tRNA formyltransferase [Fretibacterium sp.]|nr:methionyl-tRNA formyltransferase [Fretibacterium sp.]